MNGRLFLAAAPLALLASPVLAQSATGTVAIDGSVAGRCLFTTDNATISLGELALSGSGATAGKLDASKVNGQNRTLVGWCNSTAATMSVTSTALTNQAVAASGFDNRVDYTATALANSVSATDSSVGGMKSEVKNDRPFTSNTGWSSSGVLISAGIFRLGSTWRRQKCSISGRTHSVSRVGRIYRNCLSSSVPAPLARLNPGRERESGASSGHWASSKITTCMA